MGKLMQIKDLNFLVAEPDSGRRAMLLTMLKMLGAQQFIEADDGKQGLEAHQHSRAPIDISFITLDMPLMDGLELVRHLAAEGFRSAVVLVAGEDSSILLSAEYMAKAYGIQVLGTLETSADVSKIKRLIHDYQLSLDIEKKAKADGPVFTLDEIMRGLMEKQFVPFYQPIVDLVTGAVVGAEVFARWLHPQHGILSPTIFIPVLEINKRIADFSWAIVEESLATCRTWHDAGHEISVSFNFSPSLLADPAFADQLAPRIAPYGVAPKYITFEIPESAAVTSDPFFLETLIRLRMKGFGLAVDDYGTGQSNIQQLARIPFTALKVDRSFVDGAAQNSTLGLVLSTCMDLARKLNRYPAAVGVETKQDWDFLQELGSRYAQGYYIAKPMDRAAFSQWMEEWEQFF
jgi:EAL domain-containing protein (putative c-di-GMP-specific phosphodiesterase class I)